MAVRHRGSSELSNVLSVEVFYRYLSYYLFEFYYGIYLMQPRQQHCAILSEINGLF